MHRVSLGSIVLFKSYSVLLFYSHLVLKALRTKCLPKKAERGQRRQRDREDRETEKADRQIGQRDREVERQRQRYREAERQRDREAFLLDDRLTHTYPHKHTILRLEL